MEARPELSVVVPVRDEADNIAPLVCEIEAALAGRDFEIVYVDDGSRDGTAKALTDQQAESPRLRVVTHDRSHGQSVALRTGVRAARGVWIATLDGDGQNDPADIPRLLAVRDTADEPLTLVAGRRATRQDHWSKRVASRIANWVRARLLADPTPDAGCGLRLIRRDSYLELPYFDHMHRFLSTLVLRAGGRIASVAISHRPRTRGSSKYGIWDRALVGVVDLCGVMWLQRRAGPPNETEKEE